MDDTLNLREIIGKFWARKWFIATCIIIGAALAFVGAKLMTPIYTGEALVQIKPDDPANGASAEAAIRRSPEALPTQVMVLQSRTLARQTIERLQLDRDPEFVVRRDKGNTPAASDAAASPAAPAPPEAPGTAIVDGFLKRLQVTLQPHSNVIAVSFKSSRPTIAALVLNTLVQLYLDQLTNEKNRALAQESERIDQVIVPMLRQKVFLSEADLKTYEQYLTRSNELHARLGQARPDANLLSAADPPLWPSFPKTSMMVMLGGGLGGGVSILLITLIDFLRGGLYTTAQVENALGIRCLGSVPMLPAPHPGWLRSSPLGSRDIGFLEAIRSVELRLRDEDKNAGSRVILVTSALPGEGKTSVAVDLAASLSTDGLSIH